MTRTRRSARVSPVPRRRAVRAGLGVLITTAVATAGVVAVRRAQTRQDSGTTLSGAAVPLDRQMRTPLGEAGDARSVPPPWEPAALTALAGWAPPPPRHPVGWTAAYAWAAPLTCAGLLVGALTGVRPQLRDGVILFARARGPAGAVLRRRRYSAGAIGHVVIALSDPSPRLLAHELVHVRHAERLGVLSAGLYLALLAVYGYAQHPLERAARAAARRAVGTS